MTEELDNLPRFLGVSTNGPWIQFARRNARKAKDQIVASILGGASAFPNSILLPRFPGEPARLDLGEKPHPRGTGLSWPLESIVDLEHGAGRLPIGLVMETIESGDFVEWMEADTHRYRVSECLAESLAQIVGAASSSSELVYVIPNSWGTRLQQGMIDAFRRYDLKCKLLWRPIAAALEWLDRFGDNLTNYEKVKYTTAGSLLSVYIGYEHLEITELDLVVYEHEDRQFSLVPGRGRPSKLERLPSFGYRQRLKYLDSEYERTISSQSTELERFSWNWNRLWCTPLLSAARGSVLKNEPIRRSVDCKTDRVIFPLSQLEPLDLYQRLRPLSSRLHGEYTGIVVSGSLANLAFDESSRVWDWVIRALRVESESILVEGMNCELGLLAKGACRFAELLEAKLPTYLDTLPQLEMVISESGEPKWIELLDPAEKWVDGGRVWQRSQQIQNLAIAPNSTELKLAIAHEEFDTIREVIAPLPCSSESVEKVALSVEILPAQGNARIELHPARKAFFGNDRVYVNWLRMSEVVLDDGKAATKDTYLQNLPRIFPELLPRLRSRSKLQAAQIALHRVWEMMRQEDRVTNVNKALKNARNALREKDQAMYPRDATAFDSEGRCEGSFSIVDFMKTAWPYYLRHQPEDFVRAIAYTHIDHPEFHEHIRESIQWYTPEDFVIAAGKCLRDPEHIAHFFRWCLSERGVVNMNTTRLKAASEILRFRANATKLMSSDLCLSLMTLACNIFEQHRKRGSGKELFRLVCLVIVYTLRRRAFDDGFLDPQSELAIRIKSEFRKALADARAGTLRLIGGSVNLSQQLQLIIDYVDRQGRGQLLIGD